jgi:hypothetical protein
MKHSTLPLATALVSLTLVCFGASPSSGSAQKYRQDAKGLEKQFEPFIKTYEKGDESAQEEAFKIFQIPNAKEWFSGYFREADVQQLVWDAESETEQEGKTLHAMMVGGEAGFMFTAMHPSAQIQGT